jgi:hypothetical protein
MRNIYRILVDKPERKKPLGRPKCRCEDNIRVNLEEIGLGRVWAGYIWLRIGTSVGLLLLRWQ